ncbi:MAG: hypothetical protein OXP66_06185 [Candidatus Tectomicrobia bacterium]|nr:hypothetical protein [Candidatus Tectomicrobia bacterium]
MPCRIFAAVCAFVLLAPIQASWSQESDVLSELRALRADLETFVIPADVEGNWRLVYQEEADMPAWMRAAVPQLRTFVIRQYGNHVVVDDRYGDGSIQGNYLQFVLFSVPFNLVEGAEGGNTGQLWVTGEVTSATTIDVLMQANGWAFSESSGRMEMVEAAVHATLERTGPLSMSPDDAEPSESGE